MLGIERSKREIEAIERTGIVTLTTPSDSYESWKRGDQDVTKEQARNDYITGEKFVRELFERLGASYKISPIASLHLTDLGINPETLEPLELDSSK